jgi:lipopolysaccharide export system protein LptA
LVSPVAAGDTNHVQVAAQTMTLLLATTNRPHRRASAETGVVVTSPADDLRATGDRLTWQEETGLAELVGHATWSGEGRLVQADTFVIDRTNKVFHGTSNTFFRLPLQSVGPAALGHTGTNRAAVSNLFLEVFASEFTYRTNTLDLRGAPVRARLLEGERLQGVLRCGLLTVHASNRLDRLLAEKHVVAEHYPPIGSNGLAVTNLLTCEVLAVRFSESGEVIATVASEHVQAAQIQARAAPGKSVVSELTCSLLTAVLLPKSGLMDKLQAEDHVALSQGDKRARAETALYTDKEQQVTLTGHPEVEYAGGKVTGAEALIWDRASGAFRGRGKYRIEWTTPAVPTNLPAFLFLKK